MAFNLKSSEKFSEADMLTNSSAVQKIYVICYMRIINIDISKEVKA